MTSRLTLAATAILILAPATWAQAPMPAYFRWQTGQVLNYRVQQVFTASETTSDGKTDMTTQLALLKRWQVLAVDQSGGATLQMSLTAVRMATKKPDGTMMTFDSTKADGNTPELAEEMVKYLNVPLTVVRVDGRGQLVEVKEHKFGPASRLEAELPFRLVLPDLGPAKGQEWVRSYSIRLDPPQGTGESHAAMQKFACSAMNGPLATITVTSSLPTPPAATEQAPLLPLLPEGELVFDIQNGRLKSAKLKVAKKLDGHQGEGSSYSYTSE